MDETPLRIVQVSDIHLYGDKAHSLLGVNTQESFTALITHLKQDKKSDLILLTGDLSQDGSKASYVYITDVLKELEVPVYYIPGNHDNLSTMMEVYPRENISQNKHIVLKNWHIILLNSQKDGCV